MFIPSSHSGLTKKLFQPHFLLSLYSADMSQLVCWIHKEQRAGTSRALSHLRLPVRLPRVSVWSGMKKQDFLHSGEDTRTFMQLMFFQTYLLFNYTQLKRETQLAVSNVSSLLVHCSPIPPHVPGAEAVLVDSMDGWRLRSS